jgi:endo-1,4-beta-xylanase
MEFLKTLSIPFEQLIVPDVPHSAHGIYEKNGLDIMKFHAENFKATGVLK